MFTKSSRIENLRSEVVGNRWNTSETVGMYKNSRINTETFEKGISFCIFKFILTIFNNGQVNRIEN